MEYDLGCVVYLDTDTPLDDLRTNLAQHFTNSQPIPLGFAVEQNEVEIIKNIDYRSAERQKFPDGFLYFRYRVEVFPDENNPPDLSTQVKLVAALLEYLWGQHFPSVAACDYEDQLPHAGGYKSKAVPWGDIQPVNL